MSSDATRRLLIVAVVALVGLLVGVATTGLPQTVSRDIESVDINTPAPTSTAVATTSIPSATTSRSPASSAPPTTDDESTSEPAGTGDTSTTSSFTTPESTAPFTTSFTPETVATPASTTLVPIESISVVVVNATDFPGLAADTRDALRGLGYGDVEATDAIDNVQSSIVYYRLGRAAEARRLTDEIGIGADDVAPQPDDQLAVDGLTGDIVVLLGTDRL